MILLPSKLTLFKKSPMKKRILEQIFPKTILKLNLLMNNKESDSGKDISKNDSKADFIDKHY